MPISPRPPKGMILSLDCLPCTSSSSAGRAACACLWRGRVCPGVWVFFCSCVFVLPSVFFVCALAAACTVWAAVLLSAAAGFTRLRGLDVRFFSCPSGLFCFVESVVIFSPFQKIRARKQNGHTHRIQLSCALSPRMLKTCAYVIAI